MITIANDYNDNYSKFHSFKQFDLPKNVRNIMIILERNKIFELTFRLVLTCIINGSL